MNQQILDYIKSQRVGVLAVEMSDGSPHAATLHFAHSEDPLAFYFETDPKSRKAETFLGKAVVRVSFVFTPAWWRFTDWSTPEGKKIWSSE